MSLTEKEAQRKDCPFKFGRNPDQWSTQCVASECMAWRWVPDKDGETMKKVGDEYFDVGYCGLAGKPRGVA